MKKIITCFLFVFLTVLAIAQEATTIPFLGIPIDGKKADFITALRNKGFEYDSKNDFFTGKFNGMDSHIYISENNGKVDRIYVSDANLCDEAQIRIRYNNLILQFRKNNNKYFELPENELIPDDEDISYQMLVNDKLYDASFYFNPTFGWPEEKLAALGQDLYDEIQAEIESGEYENPTEEKTGQLLAIKAMRRLLDMAKGQAWFRISEHYGKYFISLYYDNLDNRSNGEDL